MYVAGEGKGESYAAAVSQNILAIRLPCNRRREICFWFQKCTEQDEVYLSSDPFSRENNEAFHQQTATTAFMITQMLWSFQASFLHCLTVMLFKMIYELKYIYMGHLITAFVPKDGQTQYIIIHNELLSKPKYLITCWIATAWFRNVRPLPSTYLTLSVYNQMNY